MTSLDTRVIVDRLRTLESLAMIPRVASTQLVARRIVNECIENELSLPQAIIIAGEQTAGRGRNQRTWSSPAGKGIYTTILLTREPDDLALVPLQMANFVSSYLRDRFGIAAGIKWPNDVLVGGKKIAGILIEARMQEGRAYMAIGIGVNVEPAEDESRPNAVSIGELEPQQFRGLADATAAFIEHLDRRLGEPLERERVLAEWREHSVHRIGDAITCVLHDRTISGTWNGIDDQGRALLRGSDGTIAISAGDLMLES